VAKVVVTHLGAFHVALLQAIWILGGRRKMMAKQSKNGHSNGNAQLQWHRLHLGLYARVAKQLHVNPSYVSRVARGKRQSDDVKKALLHELARINASKPSLVPDSRRMARSA
jgi:hypothetical protein